MPIRVPLIQTTSVAVVHRLDVAGTRAFDPPGADSSGYDDDLSEPIVYTDGAARVSARRELAVVRIPCQVEMMTFERLRELGTGDAPISSTLLVFHRRDLQRLGLIGADGATLIKRDDRVSALEKRNSPGVVVRPLGDVGLFVFEMRPASWGFGPDGYDLELCILADRPEGAV